MRPVSSIITRQQYCVSKKKLLLSGDVELNTGPLTFKKVNDISSPALNV